jgi:hypothetical protein
MVHVKSVPGARGVAVVRAVPCSTHAVAGGARSITRGRLQYDVLWAGARPLSAPSPLPGEVLSVRASGIVPLRTLRAARRGPCAANRVVGAGSCTHASSHGARNGENGSSRYTTRLKHNYSR